MVCTVIDRGGPGEEYVCDAIPEAIPDETAGHLRG